MKITYIGEDIVGINGPDVAGANSFYRHAKLCGDVSNHPDWYKVVGGNVVLRDNWEAIQSAKQSALTAVQQRLEDIATAQENSGLNEVTPLQAINYIDGQLDAATSVAETKEALRRILKRMVPYLLK